MAPLMAVSPDVLCLRCRARIPEAGAQRLCPACVTLLMDSDHRDSAARFAAGDRVQIIQGVFAGQAAEVVEIQEDGVVRARCSIMKIPLEMVFLPWQLLREGQKTI